MLAMARREPQRGPGKHYRGALSPPFCMSWDREAEGVEREETWGEVSTHHPNRGLGERRKLSQRGPGWSPAENGFYAYFRSERSHLEHHFQYFWATAGPPNVAGPGNTFPPFPPLDGLSLKRNELRWNELRGIELRGIWLHGIELRGIEIQPF